MSDIQRQQIRTSPSIHRDFWSFSITGRVRHPLVWAYAELTSLPIQTIRTAILCSAGTAATSIRIVDWRGIPASTLLANVEPEPGASFARVHSADGYTTILTRTALETGLLVLEADGAPLSDVDGAPARLIIPKRFGYKQAKWVERIEWVDQPTGGLWEDRGYDLDGEVVVRIAGVQTSAVQNTVEISGMALGTIVPESIMVSIENSDWMPAHVNASDCDDTGIHLIRWSAQWTAPHSGAFRAKIRAISNSTNEMTITHLIRVN